MKEMIRKNSGSLLAIVVAALVVAALFAGGVSAALTDGELSVRAFLFSGKKIAYDDINSIVLTDQLVAGSRKFGVSSARLRAGSFNNSQFGDYSLYAYNSVPVWIVADTKSGYVVFNLDSEEKTRAFYDQLLLSVGLLADSSAG